MSDRFNAILRTVLGCPGPMRPADFVDADGFDAWYCHGCGYAHQYPFESCCFCPDTVHALRGESEDAPYLKTRRYLQARHKSSPSLAAGALNELRDIGVTVLAELAADQQADGIRVPPGQSGVFKLRAIEQARRQIEGEDGG